MHAFPTLIRRELWEHRALWIAPPVVAVLLLLSAAFAQVDAPFGQVVPHEKKQAIFALAQWALTIPQYLVMSVLLFFYLLDCLYAERRDRSILFWKSLPVSDAATVSAKLLVALAVVPLGVFLLALVTNALFTAIWGARFGEGSLIAWDTVTWLKVQGLMLIGLVATMLWYAPIAAYLLLVSAWARRSVFVWAVLPPLLVIIVERVALGSSHASEFLRNRLVGFWEQLGVERSFRAMSGDGLPSLARLYDQLEAGAILASADLWLGLAAAAALTFAAIRVRRFRDDT